jgi:hypothetical protein
MSLVWIACSSSSGSGVSSSKKLLVLSASEQDKLCQYSVDVAGGPHDVSCGQGVTISVGDKATCLSQFELLTDNCTATVDDAETCAESMSKDPCRIDVNACFALRSCVPDFRVGQPSG